MRSLIAVLALLSLPALAAGQTVCGKPVTRYIDVVTTFSLKSSTLQSLHTFSTAFVFADGSYLSSAVNGVSFQGGPIGGTQGQIVRATSSQVSFDELRGSANEIRIGLQKSCRINRFGAEASYLVKWYGRNGRTHSFVVSSTGDAPLCEPGVASFIDLLLSYVRDATSTAERFVTPS